MRLAIAVLLSLSLSLSLAACGGLESPPAPRTSSDPLGFASWVECTVTATLLGEPVTLTHTRYDFADGSVLATCAISDSARESGSTALYRDTQPGALNAECGLTYDVDAPTGGRWTFQQATDGQGGLVSTATYADASSPHDGMALTLACTLY